MMGLTKEQACVRMTAKSVMLMSTGVAGDQSAMQFTMKRGTQNKVNTTKIKAMVLNSFI